MAPDPHASLSPHEGLIRIVDDFYSDPDTVRGLALEADYNPEISGQGFAGAESSRSFFTAQLVARFADILGQRILTDPEVNVFGRFRISTKDSRRPTKVHCDLGVDWTGVVYLSPEAPEDGGLAVYRHKASGLSQMPKTDAEARLLGFEDRADVDNQIVLANSLDASRWEQIAYCEMRYNRLILFQGCRLFHAANEVFGDDLETGRLSQHFFFDESAT